MLLTSTLEPNGPKSTGHYAVLHLDNSSELVRLPETYPDLEDNVKRLYNVDPGGFLVETDSLNVCCGKRIRIPRVLWADVAPLLGNIYIVVRSAKNDDSFRDAEAGDIWGDAINTGASHGHLQSPEDAIERPSRAPTATKGQFDFNLPLSQQEVLVITLGIINFGPYTTSCSCNFQVLDEIRECALTVNISSGSGKTVFSSNDSATITRSLKDSFPLPQEHFIILYKQNTRFLLLYDGHFVASVDATNHSQLTFLAYDLGAPPLFNGPVTATVYAGYVDVLKSLGHSEPWFRTLGKDVLYEQILACNPSDAENVRGTLAAIRGESSSGSFPPGITWKNKQIRGLFWSDFSWDYRPRSMLVVRFVNHDAFFKSWGDWSIAFGDLVYHTLRIVFENSNHVRFEETDRRSLSNNAYHNATLSGGSLRSPGLHTVVLVNHDGKLHVIFDFKTSTVSPRDTLLAHKPNGIRWNGGSHVYDILVDVDVYDFGQS